LALGKSFIFTFNSTQHNLFVITILAWDDIEWRVQGNSWLWEVSGVRIAVDPILVGNLDFGVPWLYEGAKKTVKNFRVVPLSPPPPLTFLIASFLPFHIHEQPNEINSQMDILETIALSLLLS